MATSLPQVSPRHLRRLVREETMDLWEKARTEYGELTFEEATQQNFRALTHAYDLGETQHLNQLLGVLTDFSSVKDSIRLVFVGKERVEVWRRR